MNSEILDQIGMTLGVGGLIAFMFFIIYDLAKRSNAGKFGMFILFFVLGLGMFGYILKIILTNTLEI
ncbi:MAG: DUF2788 domain-containing protein [Oleibacter sp.]|nr:DUF2788 domain-containing protein [Thalassolituus sp.]